MLMDGLIMLMTSYLEILAKVEFFSSDRNHYGLARMALVGVE